MVGPSHFTVDIAENIPTVAVISLDVYIPGQYFVGATEQMTISDSARRY
jgi:hypothetical protein